jgi:hypothetical protein
VKLATAAVSFMLAAVLFSCTYDRYSLKTGTETGGRAHASSDGAQAIPRHNESLLQDVSRYRTGEPSERVRTLPEPVTQAVSRKPEKNLAGLVRALTEGEGDDFQKVKNIHDWIALHISYDDRAYATQVVPDQSWVSVLKRGAAVCEGYATLFRIMCETAGFACVTVRGYSRGYGYDPETEEAIRENHAWSAVRIGGAWYPVDATWDAGFLSSSGAYVPRYDTGYLFIHPRGIIYTHYPTDERLQLVHPPCPPQDFLDLPYLTGEYFTVFEDPPRDVRKMNRAEESAVIVLPPHSDQYVVGASIMSQDEKERLKREGSVSTSHPRNLFIERAPEATVLRIHFPDKGKWYVSLHAMKKQARDGVELRETCDGTFTYTGIEYIQIADFFYQVTRGCGRTFPTLGFRALMDYTLHGPVHNPLVAGRQVRFSFTVPGEKTAVISAYRDMGDSLRRVEEKVVTGVGGLFEADMRIPEADVLHISIHAPQSTPEHPYSRTLVAYDVAAEQPD